MGRSPVLATVTRSVARPALASMSPSPRKYSPGTMAVIGVTVRDRGRSGGRASSHKCSSESLSAPAVGLAAGPLRTSAHRSHCPRPRSVWRPGPFAQVLIGVTVRDRGRSGGWASSRTRSSDGMVDGDELGPVREGALHLDLLDHLGHALHDVVAGEHGHPEGHQVGHRAPVPDALEELGGDQRYRFRIVEAEAPAPPAAGEIARREDHQLVLLARCQVHGLRRSGAPSRYWAQTVRCSLTMSWRRSAVAPCDTMLPLRMMA